jgi:uncharacterized protein YrrD
MVAIASFDLYNSLKGGLRWYSKTAQTSIHLTARQPVAFTGCHRSETKEVTHIVIQKGLFNKDDKVINVQNVASTSEEEVTLSCTFDELKEMPPLEIEQVVPLGDNPGQVMSYNPLTGGPYTVEHSLITETIRTIPDNLVALKEGAKVMSGDDEHIGNVERVFIEEETGKVTHIIVSQGLLQKTRKSIPIQWVKMLGDDKVRLTVDTHQLEDLPILAE